MSSEQREGGWDGAEEMHERGYGGLITGRLMVTHSHCVTRTHTHKPVRINNPILSHLPSSLCVPQPGPPSGSVSSFTPVTACRGVFLPPALPLSLPRTLSLHLSPPPSHLLKCRLLHHIGGNQTLFFPGHRNSIRHSAPSTCTQRRSAYLLGNRLLHEHHVGGNRAHYLPRGGPLVEEGDLLLQNGGQVQRSQAGGLALTALNPAGHLWWGD